MNSKETFMDKFICRFYPKGSARRYKKWIKRENHRLLRRIKKEETRGKND